jgi:hypothetical protein
MARVSDCHKLMQVLQTSCILGSATCVRWRPCRGNKRSSCVLVCASGPKLPAAVS